MKRLFVLCLTCALCLAGTLADEPESQGFLGKLVSKNKEKKGSSKEIGGIKYRTINATEAEVAPWQSYVEDSYLSIPERVKIDGKEYTVVGIGTSAFGNIKGAQQLVLKKVALPTTLRYISPMAFSGNTALEEVIGGEGLQTIGFSAFSGCTMLRSISLSQSLKSIGDEAFSKCIKMTSIVIPNSVDTIGANAFFRCEALKEVKIPDNATFINSGNPTFGQCYEIEKVSGHAMQYPYYPYKEIFDHCPFISDIAAVESSYSYYAHKRMMELLTDWQQKRKFETTAQWKERVTETNRDAKVKAFTEQVRGDYIAEYAPKSISKSLDKYDADYAVFTISVKEGTKSFGEIFAQVPLEEAQYFEENWSKVQMKPTYGILDNKVGVVNCTFTLGKKTYASINQSADDDTSADIAFNLGRLDFSFDDDEMSGDQAEATRVDNSIDLNVPTTVSDNERTFAVIIGNENYGLVQNVDYALNDARVFADYCRKTLGLPASNVRSYSDATYGVMMTALKDIRQIARAYKGDINVIFYYAGHGVPNEADRSAYLLPIDVDGTQTELCLSVDRLYDELNDMHANGVYVFMDACFSGSKRGEGMLASARGVALKTKTSLPKGKMVVFSAASDDQTAYPYREKGHGLFTYFLLKKFQETKGNVTLGELGDYLAEMVAQHSAVVNRKAQTPTAMPSASLTDTWRNLRLR